MINLMEDEMAYVRANAQTADWLAKCATVGKYPLTDQTPEGLRDYCDVSTGSELTAYQLDRLTDMVARRIRFGGSQPSYVRPMDRADRYKATELPSGGYD